MNIKLILRNIERLEARGGNSFVLENETLDMQFYS